MNDKQVQQSPDEKLPDGRTVGTLATRQKKLNVSRKAVGENEPQRAQREEGKEDYEKPMFLEMALNPRLNKVLASGKAFLVVTETEPYYLDVYRMIRKQERTQGTWTQEDEERYVEALEEGYDTLMLGLCLRRNDGGDETTETTEDTEGTEKSKGGHEWLR